MRYFRVFTLSLLLHLAMAFLLSLLPKPERLNLRPTTYVELLEKAELPTRPHQPPRAERQFVRQVDVPEKLLSKEKKAARFASEEERYVLEESRARAADLSANRSAEAAGGAGKQGRQRKMDFRPRSALQKIQEEIREGAERGDVVVRREKKYAEAADSGHNGKQNSASLSGFEEGLSTFGETAPDDVKFGDITALNTDRHLFYTFYARMEEKIRFRWVNYARAAVFSMPGDPRKATGRDRWITRLEILLDSEGRYLRSILHSSSGIHSLDQAPLQAFREAGQFPHPPAEMIKPDGLIHVYYTFNVHAGANDFGDQD